MPLPSIMDDGFYLMAREHIESFRVQHFHELDGKRVLEIGPSTPVAWDTIDIKPGCTYQADITQKNGFIAPETYDAVLCMEVLEHTTDPFAALEEIRRILKPGGLLIASAPMNFREHGPLPDCWRFTRHGWRVLLKDWDDVQLDVLMTPHRPLMPLHINASARRNKMKYVLAADMIFQDEAT